MPGGPQGIKRAIVSPMFRSADLREESARFEQAYYQLAQQTNFLQSHFQLFQRSWLAAVSPQTIKLEIPAPQALYGVFAAPGVAVGSWWIDTPTTTQFNFNMSAPAAGSSWFLVVNF